MTLGEVLDIIVAQPHITAVSYDAELMRLAVPTAYQPGLRSQINFLDFQSTARSDGMDVAGQAKTDAPERHLPCASAHDDLGLNGEAGSQGWLAEGIVCF
jgi:hypothetical protein